MTLLSHGNLSCPVLMMGNSSSSSHRSLRQEAANHQTIKIFGTNTHTPTKLSCLDPCTRSVSSSPQFVVVVKYVPDKLLFFSHQLSILDQVMPANLFITKLRFQLNKYYKERMREREREGGSYPVLAKPHLS